MESQSRIACWLPFCRDGLARLVHQKRAVRQTLELSRLVKCCWKVNLIEAKQTDGGNQWVIDRI